MEIRCPACKKTNKINSDEVLCLRCGADLSVLGAIRSASRHYLEQSRRHIVKGSAHRALICAQRSWDLEHTHLAARQAFMSCLLLQQYKTATKWYALAAGK